MGHICSDSWRIEIYFTSQKKFYPLKLRRESIFGSKKIACSPMTVTVQKTHAQILLSGILLD